MPSTTEEAARQRFPRGLNQPEGSFRFSVDALLLAAFAPGARASAFADLGTGCGVVGLALCLEHTHLSGIGLESDSRLIEAARLNAAMLGLEQRFSPIAHDLAEPITQLPGQVDLVTANPPWQKPKSGKAPETAMRTRALVDSGNSLAVFCAAAFRLLPHKGSLACVYDSAGLVGLLETLRKERLEPKRVRFVHSRARSAARLVLVEARKGSRPGLAVEDPLVLYEPLEQGGNPRGFTRQALAYCPFLACNSGQYLSLK